MGFRGGWKPGMTGVPSLFDATLIPADKQLPNAGSLQNLASYGYDRAKGQRTKVCGVDMRNRRRSPGGAKVG